MDSLDKARALFGLGKKTLEVGFTFLGKDLTAILEILRELDSVKNSKGQEIKKLCIEKIEEYKQLFSGPGGQAVLQIDSEILLKDNFFIKFTSGNGLRLAIIEALKQEFPPAKESDQAIHTEDEEPAEDKGGREIRSLLDDLAKRIIIARGSGQWSYPLN